MNDDKIDYRKKIKENIYILVENRKFADALELINHFEIIDKNDIDIYSIKGVIFIMEGNLDLAEKILKEGLEKDYNNFDILYNLAYVHSLKKDYLSAYECYISIKNKCKDEAICNKIEAELTDIKDKYFLETKKDLEENRSVGISDKAKKSYKKILYLGWLGQGNVGDDVLFDIFKKMIFTLKGNSEYNLMIDSFLPLNNYEVDLKQYDLIVLGGGSLYLLDYWIDICLNAARLEVPYITWGTGIDIRDNNSIAHIVKRYKKEKINISSDKLVKLLSNSKLTSTRGNVSKYILGYNEMEVIGDPCIIFDKMNDSYTDIEEVSSFIKGNDKIILVNWGTSYNNISGGNEEMVETELVKTVNKLLEKGYKIIIYPIWINDIDSCVQLSKRFQSNKIMLLKKVYDAYKIASLIKKAFMTLNFKLHANILSMSMKKPFISLGYGMKCYDFCQSIDSDELNIFTQDVSSMKIMEKISYIEENCSMIVDRFEKHIEKYYRLQFDFGNRILKILDN